ncbi:hypothetical protein [Hansschlegelia zhihuaiae]|uniref:hypothetical protein n=1 Tax=Hansschlegelia zhihuaiae TaxID=405005 RepID=UPI0013E8B290|nr:hypothetical protein [Hansschlegelia zhihuaiae]
MTRLSITHEGGCKTLVLYVGGARNGDTALITPRAVLPTGAYLQALGSFSDNYVTVRFCNDSGAILRLNETQMHVTTFR